MYQAKSVVEFKYFLNTRVVVLLVILVRLFLFYNFLSLNVEMFYLKLLLLPKF